MNKQKALTPDKKKIKVSKKGDAHSRSIQVYNSKTSDIINKRKKLEKHVKYHPNDDINISKTMMNYSNQRKVKT